MPSASASTARGKKKSTAAAAAAAAAAAEPAPVEVVVAAPAAAAPAAAPKKKGGSSSAASKKPVKVVAVVTPDGIEGSFTPEPRRPLIAHLQIRPSEVVFHDQPLRYDPNPPSLAEPEPYDASASDMFLGGQEPVFTMPAAESGRGQRAAAAVPAEEVGAATAATAASAASATGPAPTAAAAAPKGMPCFTKVDLMVQFKGASEQKKLPLQTDIACFWCAHGFEGQPAVIPEREVNGIFNVYGNFCCPECAVAYLLTEAIDPHVRWERVALLHRVYDREGKGRIFPAPARESLKLFGGPMDIETFRATVREGKVRVDVHMPPMVSILGSIDTKPIDFFDINLKGGAIGAPLMPQRSVEEGLRLKRTKPLKDKESTLDTVMNIRIGGGR